MVFALYLSLHYPGFSETILFQLSNIIEQNYYWSTGMLFEESQQVDDRQISVDCPKEPLKLRRYERPEKPCNNLAETFMKVVGEYDRL